MKEKDHEGLNTKGAKQNVHERVAMVFYILYY